MNAVKFFFLGILSALGALFLEIALSIFFPEQVLESSFYSNLTVFLLLTILIEEVSKSIFIFKSLEKAKSLYQAMLISLSLGFGFALMEAVLRLSNADIKFSWEMAGAFSIHLITSLLIGIIAYSPNGPKVSRILWALLFSSSLHLFYNLAVIYIY